MKKITSFLAILLLVCVVGCGTLTSGLGTPDLCGTMWRPKKVPPYVYIEITPDGRLVGSVEKSRFFAPLTIDEKKGKLEIGSIAVSKSVKGNRDLEKSFFEMLGKVRFYQLDEHMLSLFDQDHQPVAHLVSPFPRGKYPEQKQ